MLLIALQHIPGSISIAPGQQFYEPNSEQRATLIRTGFARPANEPLPIAQPVNVSLPAAPSTESLPAPSPSRNRFPNWQKCRIVIIASGPSLTEEQCATVSQWRRENINEPDALRRRVIVINTSYQRAPFADMLYACDNVWWDNHYEDVVKTVDSTTLLFTQDKNSSNKYDLGYIQSAPARGLSRKPELIHQGMNSGFQAINLAFLAGVRDFVLLGFDCRGTHWHGDHPAPMQRTLPHRRWIEHFEVLARDLKTENVKIVNCSPGTAIPSAIFPQVDLVTALSEQ